jgi:hypothetical protein
MKKLMLFSLLILAAFNFSFAATTKLPGQSESGNIAYLFIETADGGNLKKNPNNETYTLTLTGTDPYVTYFSNVPHRITGFTSVKEFSDLMNKEVTKQYPKGLNSGLVTIDHQNKQTLRYMLSLSNPNYDVKNKTVTFTAYAIPGKHTHPIPDKKEFAYAILFIDNLNICISCSGPF